MEMPDTMPTVFQIEGGLNPELKNEKIIFEKYSESRMRTVYAARLYANGDFYKIYMGSNDSLMEDSISWRKLGVMSPAGIAKIESISNNSVIDYLNDGPIATEHDTYEWTYWYFYFDEPKYVESQSRRSKVFPWQTPKFVRRMNKVEMQFLVYDNLRM